ncbi:hypothetical protein ACFXDE_21520 [Kitasatospora sp. NPDC059408]|uniref:hypothetical protein n=1 Tax=Kitasatospora sp. NPDC059408 TaxID=3346823 RepID=UPI0036A16751
MLTAVQVKLMPSPDVATALRDTLSTCNREANRVSELAFRTGEQSRRALQSAAYLKLKGAGLSAQPALHVIRKVADAYATLAANIRAGTGPATSDANAPSPNRSVSAPMPLRHTTTAACPGGWMIGR